MTPALARDWLLTLPPEHRDPARRALVGSWDDGFGVGAARLPRINPHDTSPPPAMPDEPRGKAR